jgi:hypothetical protein
MKKFHDIEQLSSYLDGHLSPAESARFESRLSSDPELASAFNDLRAARGILRKLPSRKAPRNFTLTRQMVGLKPPLPRSYSFFRFSTTFATILLMFTFAANALTQLPRMTFGAGAPAPAMQEDYGGMGGGGGPSESAAAPEAPELMEEIPAAPALEMEPQPTAGVDSAATELPTAKVMSTPSEMQAQPPVQGLIEPESVPQEQPRAESQALIPFALQIALLILILLSGLTAFLLRRSAIQKWK